ncbi:MAG: ATPase [Nitrososphaeria archaeon]
MRIIPRRIDVERIEKAGPWKMVYGRRKTGKTFLVESFIKYDKFFFVNRDGTVLDKGAMEKYTWQEFFKLFKEIFGEKRLVIDEFHRLPEEFLDFLHFSGVRGELILITSTLWLTKNLLGKGSPIVGLVYPIRIGLIDEEEILLNLNNEFRGRELIESSVYLREPFLIPQFSTPLGEFLRNYLHENRYFIKELLGEIFIEEERELTNVYDGILKAVADGKNVSTEISSFLFSRGLLLKDNPGVVQKYLDILVEMGILERFEVFNKRKFKYFHASPLFDLHYYLEEKYSYTEVEVPPKFIGKVVDLKLPLHVQWFFRDLFAKKFGLTPKIVEGKDFELDIALFEFKRLKLVVEVKWREVVERSEVKSIEEKLSRFDDEVRKIIIVPHKKALEKEPDNAEVWDIDTLLKHFKINFGP